MKTVLHTFFSLRMGLLFAALWLPLFFYGQVTIVDTVFDGRVDKVYFEFGKWDIQPAFDSLLFEAAMWYLDQDAPVQVKIKGHADAIGQESSNQALSLRRCEVIAQHLIGNGVPDSLIEINGFGETLPISDNDTEEGRAKNRRVSIRFLEPGKAMKIYGQLIDNKSLEGIAGRIIANVKGQRDTIETDSSGLFEAILPLKGIVNLIGFAQQYYFNNRFLNPGLSLPDTLVTIPLQKIFIGEIIEVENLYFISNTPKLIQRSEPELDKLVFFMQSNPKVMIEISGHVNVPGITLVTEQTWQYELSYLRARMVYNHLVKNGVSSHRMEFRGYGNWKMKYRNPRNPEEGQANRRVEIRVLNDGTLK